MNAILDTKEEKISEPEDTAMETVQNKTSGEQRLKRKWPEHQ